MATTILLAQTNYLVKEGLKSLISREKTLQCAGFASNSDELIEKVFTLNPDLVIIDHLDTAFGISAMRKIVQIKPGVRILSISDKPSRWMLSDALAAGLTSYLLRDCEEDEIIEAIAATVKGDQFFCGKILNEVLRPMDEAGADAVAVSCEGLKISVREAEIIRLVAEGFTNKEIADKLFLSAHTVTTHRKNIMAKLGINNTAGMVLFAIKNNIVTPNHFLFNTN